jgi:hypothetical protein
VRRCSGFHLVGTELSEERKGAQAQPFEHVTAGTGGRRSGSTAAKALIQARDCCSVSARPRA